MHLLTCLVGEHGHQHKKREVVVVTEVAYTTVDVEDVIVYVDKDGNPVTSVTVQRNQAIPTHPPASSPSTGEVLGSSQTRRPQPPLSQQQHSQTPSPSPPPPPVPPPPASTPTPYHPAPSPAQPAPSVNQPESPAPAPKPSSPPTDTQPGNAPSHPAPPNTPSSSGPGFRSGISYSPYNADNTCKSTSQVADDFKAITGFSVVRLYGTDCNQISNVLAAIEGKGISLFLGIFDLTQIPAECKIIVDAVKGDWSLINTVSIGNELVNKGGASVGQVTAAIGQVRSTLKGAGYNGPVVTVDTMVAMKANPDLCLASDFCAINCHAFFDGNVAANGAGKFVLDWAQQVSEAAGGKTVVITETGWPTQGDTNNKAIPSKENQDAAIASIKEAFGQNAILYSAFNDMWKKDSADTHNAEKFWGIL